MMPSFLNFLVFIVLFLFSLQVHGVPTITSITPNFGLISGGTVVTITGIDLKTGPPVDVTSSCSFGDVSVPVQGFSLDSASNFGVICTTPPIPSTTYIRVTVPVSVRFGTQDEQTLTTQNVTFDYFTPPTFSSFSPTIGNTNSLITIIGKNFHQISSSKGKYYCLFSGSIQVTASWKSDSTLYCEVPFVDLSQLGPNCGTPNDTHGQEVSLSVQETYFLTSSNLQPAFCYDEEVHESSDGSYNSSGLILLIAIGLFFIFGFFLLWFIQLRTRQSFQCTDLCKKPGNDGEDNRLSIELDRLDLEVRPIGIEQASLLVQYEKDQDGKLA